MGFGISGFEIIWSLPPSDESDFSAGAAEDDGGELIGVSSKLNSCLKPNDIYDLVNNC
jgi:hypothetical protein